jgi:hypothetical protein
VDLPRVDLFWVDLLRVVQMVLLVVPRKCTFLVWAFFPLVVLSIQMEGVLFHQYHLCLAGPVGLVLFVTILTGKTLDFAVMTTRAEMYH